MNALKTINGDATLSIVVNALAHERNVINTGLKSLIKTTCHEFISWSPRHMGLLHVTYDTGKNIQACVVFLIFSLSTATEFARRKKTFRFLLARFYHNEAPLCVLNHRHNNV